MSSRDECGSRIAESEIKKRGQREKRHRGLYYIDGTLIREGKKRTSLFRFADRFLLFRILFFTTIFSTIFSRSKGGRKGATAVYRQRRRATSKRGIEGGGTKAEGTSRESKRKVALSLSFATAFGQRISRLRRGGESRSEPR